MKYLFILKKKLEQLRRAKIRLSCQKQHVVGRHGFIFCPISKRKILGASGDSGLSDKLLFDCAKAKKLTFFDAHIWICAWTGDQWAWRSRNRTKVWPRWVGVFGQVVSWNWLFVKINRYTWGGRSGTFLFRAVVIWRNFQKFDEILSFSKISWRNYEIFLISWRNYEILQIS